jgi:hypothetical protein
MVGFTPLSILTRSVKLALSSIISLAGMGCQMSIIFLKIARVFVPALLRRYKNEYKTGWLLEKIFDVRI